jgi:hypothetical protein
MWISPGSFPRKEILPARRKIPPMIKKMIPNKIKILPTKGRPVILVSACLPSGRD